jgi:hypothetical protein
MIEFAIVYSSAKVKPKNSATAKGCRIDIFLDIEPLMNEKYF